MTDAQQLVRALKGRWSGSTGMARCPAHNDKSPSLSIAERDGKVLAHCFAGCTQEEVWAALTRMELVGGDDTRRRRNTPVRRSTRDADANQREADAKRIWAESVPAIGTLAQDYLAGRGILIQVREAIRYHLETNALIAAVQDRTGEITGIQRIFLEQDAAGVFYRKKRSLGRISGGAVRLTPPAKRLQLAESVEDALALQQITGYSTWAVLGAGFMASFEPPAGCREIILAPDNDTAGREAIEKAARALTRRGLTVRVWLPPIEGSDWCDFLDTWEERAALIEEGDGLDRAAAETEAYRTLNDVYST